MCDFYGPGRRIEFSEDFARTLQGLSSVPDGMETLARIGSAGGSGSHGGFFEALERRFGVFERSVRGTTNKDNARDNSSACHEAGREMSEAEARLLRKLADCMHKHGKREVELSGLTPTGIEHLKDMLARAGISASYQPMRHHYRSPSEPARLVLS